MGIPFKQSQNEVLKCCYSFLMQQNIQSVEFSFHWELHAVKIWIEMRTAWIYLQNENIYICYWLNERLVQEFFFRLFVDQAVGEVHKQATKEQVLIFSIWILLTHAQTFQTLSRFTKQTFFKKDINKTIKMLYFGRCMDRSETLAI